MYGADLRQDFLIFFAARGHSKIARSNLVPREDPTTLFTGSGMQPLIPYLLGSPHPLGSRLVDSQPCFRAEDIDEIGDARHTTFFEMLGNWSLGDYFKEEQLPWLFEFLTDVVGLDPTRLYVTAFSGSEELVIPRDTDSVRIWGELFAWARVEAPVVELGNCRLAGLRGVGEARIVLYDESQCWWSRSGPPAKMPVGEPGGPDSEVFYLFPQVEHDKALGEHCHPHCDCGRFVEIGNSVFMQYRRTTVGFEALPHPNVDFGGGLERLAMAAIDAPEVFAVDLLAPIVDMVREMAQQADPDRRALRIVADHARAVTFLALDGVEPSNNTQGYIMRRFARRALRQGLHLGIESELLARLVDVVANIYSDAYPELVLDAERVRTALDREEDLFRRTLARGVRELPKLARDGLDGTTVFILFDTYGFRLN
jgi:alanyl-tRNA synthetase